MGPQQVLSLQVKVNQGVMVMKEALHIPQSSRTGALPSDGLMSYLGHLLGEYYPSAEMQLVYSTALTSWAV